MAPSRCPGRRGCNECVRGFGPLVSLSNNPPIQNKVMRESFHRLTITGMCTGVPITSERQPNSGRESFLSIPSHFLKCIILFPSCRDYLSFMHGMLISRSFSAPASRAASLSFPRFASLDRIRSKSGAVNFRLASSELHLQCKTHPV